MAGGSFDSVAEAQEQARRRLPRSVYLAVIAGLEKGCTLADNVAAFDEVEFAPRLAGRSARRDMATRVLGQDISMPVVLSPTGLQGILHPDAEIAVARAAAAAGLAMGLSNHANSRLADVAAANPRVFFQLYWSGGRDEMAAKIERARNEGAVGIILTLDWAFASGRDWGATYIPASLDPRAILRFAPEVLPRPAWLIRHLMAGKLPKFAVPNMADAGQPPPPFPQAYGQWMMTPPPAWDDVAWVIAQWNGPLMVKGVMGVDDAKRAVDAGASAISVSNHGGNYLDGAPASLRVLPAIADAVGRQVEVLMDGGVRRGGDVAKAMALGARAVMIGRAYLWGLVLDGQPGVEHVIQILRRGLDSTLLALGHGSVHELSRADLHVSGDFRRPHGDAPPPSTNARSAPQQSGSLGV